jgi:acyl-CoA thioesterase II
MENVALTIVFGGLILSVPMGSMPSTQSDAVRALELETEGAGRFRGHNLPTGPGVVHAGQLIGHMIVAAARTVPDKQVRSIHTVFTRIARTDLHNEIEVEVVHSGRVFSSLTVSFRQAGRICGRSQVLMAGEEADLIRHDAAMPAVVAFGEAVELVHDQVTLPGELRACGRDAAGKPSVANLWFRFLGAPDDPAIHQALLAPPTALFLISTALEHHPEIHQDRPHESVDSGTITHAMYFHARVRLDDWLLLAHDSPFAGAGQTFGRGQAFTRDGSLVASYDQESLVRAMREWSRRD